MPWQEAGRAGDMAGVRGVGELSAELRELGFLRECEMQLDQEQMSLLTLEAIWLLRLGRCASVITNKLADTQTLLSRPPSAGSSGLHDGGLCPAQPLNIQSFKDGV